MPKPNDRTFAIISEIKVLTGQIAQWRFQDVPLVYRSPLPRFEQGARRSILLKLKAIIVKYWPLIQPFIPEDDNELSDRRFWETACHLSTTIYGRDTAADHINRWDTAWLALHEAATQFAEPVKSGGGEKETESPTTDARASLGPENQAAPPPAEDVQCEEPGELHADAAGRPAELISEGQHGESDGSVTTVADAGYYSCADLAEKHQVPEEALDQRLRRWRVKNPSGAWTEEQNPQKGEPRYRYREEAVKHIIDDLRRNRRP